MNSQDMVTLGYAKDWSKAKPASPPLHHSTVFGDSLSNDFVVSIAEMGPMSTVKHSKYKDLPTSMLHK